MVTVYFPASAKNKKFANIKMNMMEGTLTLAVLVLMLAEVVTSVTSKKNGRVTRGATSRVTDSGHVTNSGGVTDCDTWFACETSFESCCASMKDLNDFKKCFSQKYNCYSVCKKMEMKSRTSKGRKN